MLRTFSQNGGVEVYELYHRLLQEYNECGPDRKGKRKQPTYLIPGRDLNRSIWLHPMADFHDAKSVIKSVFTSSRRSLCTNRTIHTSRTMETVGMVEASIGDRGDSSSVTSVRTMYYSTQENDDWISKIT